MSVQAKIRYVQGGNVGNVGEALIGVASSSVTASSAGSSTETIVLYTWTWVDTPPGSSIPVGAISSGGGLTSIAFTPDVVGDYHLELRLQGTTGAVSVDRRVFRIVRDRKSVV